jgi:hypothetical protein
MWAFSCHPGHASCTQFLAFLEKKSKKPGIFASWLSLRDLAECELLDHQLTEC